MKVKNKLRDKKRMHKLIQFCNLRTTTGGQPAAMFLDLYIFLCLCVGLVLLNKFSAEAAFSANFSAESYTKHEQYTEYIMEYMQTGGQKSARKTCSYFKER